MNISMLFQLRRQWSLKSIIQEKTSLIVGWCMYINIEGWVEKCLIVDHANANYNNDASYEITVAKIMMTCALSSDEKLAVLWSYYNANGKMLKVESMVSLRYCYFCWEETDSHGLCHHQGAWQQCWWIQWLSSKPLMRLKVIFYGSASLGHSRSTTNNSCEHIMMPRKVSCCIDAYTKRTYWCVCFIPP